MLNLIESLAFSRFIEVDRMALVYMKYNNEII